MLLQGMIYVHVCDLEHVIWSTVVTLQRKVHGVNEDLTYMVCILLHWQKYQTDDAIGLFKSNLLQYSTWMQAAISFHDCQFNVFFFAF